MKSEMIAKINAFVQENLVKDIRFLAGVLKNDQNNEQDADTKSDSITQKIQNEHLEKEDITAAKNMVSEIRDENLRKKILWVLEKELLLKKVKQRENWHPCGCCGVLCSPDEQYCTVCQREIKQKHFLHIRKFLLDAPWISHEEAIQYLQCTKKEFYQVKNSLMGSLEREVYRNHADTLKTNTLVMLMKGVKPGEFDEEFVQHTLKKIRRKKYVPAFRS
jgi:hypothetical protein